MRVSGLAIAIHIAWKVYQKACLKSLVEISFFSFSESRSAKDWAESQVVCGDSRKSSIFLAAEAQIIDLKNFDPNCKLRRRSPCRLQSLSESMLEEPCVEIRYVTFD